MAVLVFHATIWPSPLWPVSVSERLCTHYREDYGIETRVVRFHNIFGPLGVWDGGREKAPAAICRKVAVAKLTGNPVVEIWGDGEQKRSFCYIDDCVKGIHRLMRSDFHEPFNLGQDRIVTINQLAEMETEIAGIVIEKKHLSGPTGVRGRNSDNTLLRKVVGWEPEISLEAGLEPPGSSAQVRPWCTLKVPNGLMQRPFGSNRCSQPMHGR
jgi:GDP-D-mannose 3',5'-epimerase